jgi:hypothetical protein
MCLLHVLKDDIDDFEEAMFQGVEMPCEIIFCIQGIEKSYIDGRLSDVSSRRMAL